MPLHKSEVAWADIGGEFMITTVSNLAASIAACRTTRDKTGHSGDPRMAYEICLNLRSIAVTTPARVGPFGFFLNVC